MKLKLCSLSTLSNRLLASQAKPSEPWIKEEDTSQQTKTKIKRSSKIPGSVKIQPKAECFPKKLLHQLTSAIAIPPTMTLFNTSKTPLQDQAHMKSIHQTRSPQRNFIQVVRNHLLGFHQKDSLKSPSKTLTSAQDNTIRRSNRGSLKQKR